MEISQSMSPLMRRTKTNLSRDPGTKRRDSISPSVKSPLPAQSPKISTPTPNTNIDQSRIESNISHLPQMNLKASDDETPKGMISPEVAVSPSAMHVQRIKESALIKDSNRGALTIMNVTFNEDSLHTKGNVREQLYRSPAVKRKPYGTSAFHQTSKRRLERIQQQNDEMKERTLAVEVPPRPGRQSQTHKSPQFNKVKAPQKKVTPAASIINSSTNFDKKEKDALAAANTTSSGQMSPLNSFQIQGPIKVKKEVSPAYQRRESRRESQEQQKVIRIPIHQ